ncbi:hypothetical protein JYG23_02600 [Sedimentibacter sp. zth1]|uniref:hypothetical protein n=1 Tax=Sedimentibacter sp. zth1 TaxID=2816908 RepID=UPI001A92A864|nr:hypothetical protein [Sedimentibacter sp. zth1]QSX06369.1 hypothetical protein JYG23_02600 [Sedimentibacter sp. zth1]
MKKIIDWFKNLFYCLTDYTLIIGVVVVVALILVWRLNILFNLKVDKETIANEKPPIQIDNNVSENTESETSGNNKQDTEEDTEKDTDIDTETKANENENTSDSNTDDNTNQEENTNVTEEPGKEITFTIPAGSFSGKIADILLENGLINDTDTFLERCGTLKLDTKLKAGDFTIVSGSDLDKILEILSR